MYLIFNLQSKLVKLFSKQLIAKSQITTEDSHYHDKLKLYPKTDQWLTVVGLQEDVIKVYCKVYFDYQFCLSYI